MRVYFQSPEGQKGNSGWFLACGFMRTPGALSGEIWSAGELKKRGVVRFIKPRIIARYNQEKRKRVIEPETSVPWRSFPGRPLLRPIQASDRGSPTSSRADFGLRMSTASCLLPVKQSWGSVGAPRRAEQTGMEVRCDREAMISLLEKSHFGYPTRAERTKTEISPG